MFIASQTTVKLLTNKLITKACGSNHTIILFLFFLVNNHMIIQLEVSDDLDGMN